MIALADRRKGLANFFQQVKAAKNVAIVGSGIVAVELAGDLSY